MVEQKGSFGAELISLSASLGMAEPTCPKPDRDQRELAASCIGSERSNFRYRIIASRLPDRAASASGSACGLFLVFLCARNSLIMALHLREWWVAAQAVVGVKNFCDFRIAPTRPHPREHRGRRKDSFRSRFHHSDEIVEKVARVVRTGRRLGMILDAK